MTTVDLTAANFKQTVFGNNIVLVYVWSKFCKPCEIFTPTYQASSEKHFDIVHGKLDYETEKELVELAKIQFMPVLMAFKEGKLVFKQGGIANPAVMDDLVAQLRTYNVAANAL